MRRYGPERRDSRLQKYLEVHGGTMGAPRTAPEAPPPQPYEKYGLATAPAPTSEEEESGGTPLAFQKQSW